MVHYEIKHAKGITPYQRGVLVDLMFDLAEANSIGSLYRTVQRDLPRVLRTTSGVDIGEVIAYERLLTSEFHGLKLKGDNNFRRFSDKPQDATEQWKDEEKRKRNSLDDEVFDALKDFNSIRKDGDLYLPVQGNADYDNVLVATVKLSQYEFHDGREREFLRLYMEAFGIAASRKLHWKAKRSETKRILEALTTIGHRLNNDITPLRAYPHLLKGIIGRAGVQGELAESASRIVGIIDRTMIKTERRIQLIRQMAMTGGVLPVTFNFEKFGVNASIRDSLFKYREDFDNRGILVLAGQLPDIEVLGDKSMLEDALVEIVKNAMHNTPSGESLTVDGKVNGDHCELRFRNTGVHRSDDQIGRLLVDGYSDRLDGTTSTGHGLTYVHGIIVGTHNGQLTFESQEEPEKYFEVQVRLPMNT